MGKATILRKRGKNRLQTGGVGILKSKRNSTCDFYVFGNWVAGNKYNEDSVEGERQKRLYLEQHRHDNRQTDYASFWICNFHHQVDLGFFISLLKQTVVKNLSFCSRKGALWLTSLLGAFHPQQFVEPMGLFCTKPVPRKQVLRNKSWTKLIMMVGHSCRLKLSKILASHCPQFCLFCPLLVALTRQVRACKHTLGNFPF